MSWAHMICISGLTLGCKPWAGPAHRVRRGRAGGRRADQLHRGAVLHLQRPLPAARAPAPGRARRPASAPLAPWVYEPEGLKNLVCFQRLSALFVRLLYDGHRAALAASEGLHDLVVKVRWSGLNTCNKPAERKEAGAHGAQHILPGAAQAWVWRQGVEGLPGGSQGAAGVMDEGGSGLDGMAGRPRKSWQMRKRQERAAIKEGLAEWQARTGAGLALVCTHPSRRACPGRRACAKSAPAHGKALPSNRRPLLL